MKRVSFLKQSSQSAPKCKRLKIKENLTFPVWRAACHIRCVRILKERRKTTMATIPKLIKAALDFSKALPEQLLTQGNAILKAMTGNVNFTNIPVDLALLKGALDAYSVSIGEARDGSRKAITLRNRQGEDVIRMLRGLALYVELNCNEDMNTFLTSGFTPRSSTRTPAQPLEQPMILSVDQGITGELLVSIKAVRKAKTYELRYGPVGSGGATP